MSDKQTFTRDEFLTDVRGANGTRAQWFALMLEEAEKHGIDPDEFCEDTIYKFGLGRGKKYGVCEGNPGKMAEMLYGSNGQDVFEMELAEKTDELESAVLELKNAENVKEESFAIRDTILGKMAALRAVADEAETQTSSDYWPFPTYGELLFGVK